jgi:hypothetical protein
MCWQGSYAAASEVPACWYLHLNWTKCVRLFNGLAQNDFCQTYLNTPTCKSESVSTHVCSQNLEQRSHYFHNEEHTTAWQHSFHFIHISMMNIKQQRARAAQISAVLWAAQPKNSGSIPLTIITARSHNSTPQCIFTAWDLIKHEQH